MQCAAACRCAAAACSCAACRMCGRMQVCNSKRCAAACRCALHAEHAGVQCMQNMQVCGSVSLPSYARQRCEKSNEWTTSPCVWSFFTGLCRWGAALCCFMKKGGLAQTRAGAARGLQELVMQGSLIREVYRLACRRDHSYPQIPRVSIQRMLQIACTHQQHARGTARHGAARLPRRCLRQGVVRARLGRGRRAAAPCTLDCWVGGACGGGG